jgi:hypothetical protein
MKNLLKKTSVMLFALSLMSCDNTFYIIGTSSQSTSSHETSSENTSSEILSENTSSESSSVVSYNKNLKSIKITLKTITSGLTYQTNYSNVRNLMDIQIGGYRVGKNFSQIYPDFSKYKGTTYEGREGSVYNTSSIGYIYSLEINYKVTDDYIYSNAKKPNITFGHDPLCTDYKYELDTPNNEVKTFVDVGNKNLEYFSINSGDYLLVVDNITITYLPIESTTNPKTSSASGLNKIRNNPIRYEGDLTPGESKVTVPTNYKYDEKTSSYVVTSSKELTYYTSNYVYDHREVIEEATITDPMEVCMYYTAFGTWPANYDMSPNRIRALFGSDTRKVSQYSRTNGYATSVPWNGVGYYYELDIGLDDDYSTSNRGTGRVVVWDTGWSTNSYYNLTATGYDSSPVCTYTDDHYNTWLEYLNNGTWSNRFNGEGNKAWTSYSPATTVELTNI